jgi:uncharacterized membrane protein
MLLDKESTHEHRALSLAQVQVGMIFAEDVRVEESGALLVARGLQVTAGMKERLHNFAKDSVKDTVSMLIPRSGNSSRPPHEAGSPGEFAGF